MGNPYIVVHESDELQCALAYTQAEVPPKYTADSLGEFQVGSGRIVSQE